MLRKIRLTESELKNIIIKTVKNVLKEGYHNSSYTHYAVLKGNNKIVNGWDYSGYDSSELRMYKKDYFVDDLVDMGMNPKDLVIWTKRTCLAKGIDPSDNANWSNYPMNENVLKENRQTWTTPIDINLSDILFSPELDEFLGDNWDSLPAEEVDVNLELVDIPGDKGDYWTPPYEGGVELIDTQIDPNSLFKEVIPEELYQLFINDVDKYIDDNIDSIVQRFEYNDFDSDWER
jgi:hypothetical protein